MDNTAVAYHAREIRRLAAACQSGANLADIKKKVDRVIGDVSRAAGGDSDHQIRIWSALLVSVEYYITNQCDPKWTDVMRHARQKIKMRRRDATKKVKTPGINTAAKAFSAGKPCDSRPATKKE